MEIILIACIVLLVVLIGKPPSGPTGPTQTMQLEAYLHSLDRRRRQLSQGRLDDW